MYRVKLLDLIQYHSVSGGVCVGVCVFERFTRFNTVVSLGGVCVFEIHSGWVCVCVGV